MSAEATTIPALFLQAVECFGPKTALRKKQLGIWKEISWDEYCVQVGDFYRRLRGAGVSKGDVVAIISENRPEWLYADLACQCLGALPLGIFPDSSDAELEYLLLRNRVRFVIAEDQQQADKILNVRRGLPLLDKCVVLDREGMEQYDNPLLVAYAALDGGCKTASECREELAQALSVISTTDIAFLCLTSGTTGTAKTASLTHRAVLENVTSFLELERYSLSDELMSYSPLALLLEKCFILIFPLIAGYCVNFPETADPETVVENIREISPSIFSSTARGWERLYRSVHWRHGKATWLKRKVFTYCMSVADRVVERTFKRERVPLHLRIASIAADLVVYRKIRDHLGFRLVRCAYTSGAVIGPEVYALYHKIGVPVRQLYAITEIGICTAQRPGEANPETAGSEIPNVHLKLSAAGEILVYAPAFAGYHDDPSVAAEVCHDGWFATGDRGSRANTGAFLINGLHTEVIETVNGERVQPELVETKLKASPYIREAVAVGHRLPHISALIQIDGENVSSWAESIRLPYTTFRDLVSKPQLGVLISRVVEEANQKLAPESRVARFTLLGKELHPDDGELTRTGKLRRRIVASQHSHAIEAMYE